MVPMFISTPIIDQTVWLKYNDILYRMYQGEAVSLQPK